MAEPLKRTDPTPQTVHFSQPAGTAGSANAVVVPIMTVKVPLSTAGGTGNAGFLAWINPERYTIGVMDVAVHFYTTGTGTFDMGVQSDGTGSANDIFQAGTMNTSINLALRSVRGRTGTEGAGSGGKAEILFLGPGGTGTNNSIVSKTAETASTAKGDVFITYFIDNR